MDADHITTAKALLRDIIAGKSPFDTLRSWERMVLSDALQKDMRTVEHKTSRLSL